MKRIPARRTAEPAGCAIKIGTRKPAPSLTKTRDQSAFASPTRLPSLLAMNQNEDAILEAERLGIDLSLVRENLLVSYEDRARRHEDALVLAMELKKAGEIFRAQSQPPSPATKPV